MKKLAVLPLVLACSQAMAFNDHREGFMMNFGIGLSNVHYKVGEFLDSDSGFATTIKIGHGFTEKFQLYYVRDASSTKQNGETYIDGLEGIGANFYLNDKTYLMGAIGVSDSAALIPLGDSATGSAYSFGVGYEFSPHHNVQLTYLATDIDLGFSTINLTTSAIQVLYSYSLY